MAGVGVGAEVLSSVIRTAREGVGGRQRCHWISSPSLPLPSARRLFKQQASRFQLLRYPVVSLCAAGSPSPPPTWPATSSSPTRLYVSGLSFRTTEESLRNAFEMFGQLTEVNLVMDKIANRPRGFAFLRYATEEEARKAIDGMHGKVDLLVFGCALEFTRMLSSNGGGKDGSHGT